MNYSKIITFTSNVPYLRFCLRIIKNNTKIKFDETLFE